MRRIARFPYRKRRCFLTDRQTSAAPDSTSNLKLRPVPLPHGVPSGPGSVVYSSLFCHHLWSRDVGKRLLFRMTYQRAFLILGFPSRVSRVSTLARWERGNGSRLLSSEPHAE